MVSPDTSISRARGAYVLLFRLPRCDALTIGRLGTFDLAPGIYAYVGSALGGLEARVGRHLRGGAKKHWHIDYLIGHGCDRSAYMVVSDRDIECELSRSIAGLPGATMPVRGFGSSDCHCSTHLFCLEPRTMELFRAQMGERGAQLATLNNFE